MPSHALEAMSAEDATGIFRIVIPSEQLKGTYIKQAKEAAAEMSAAITVLAMRAQNPTGIPIDKQLRELRSEIQLRTKN